MGSRKLGLMIMFFTFLRLFEFSSPLHDKPLHSESLQNIIQPSNKEMDKHQHGIVDVNSHNYGRNGVTHGSKIARGGTAGATGGRSTDSTENGNSDAGGGASSNHHPNTRRHGTSSSNQNCIRLLALISTAIASLAHLYTHY